MGSGADNTPRLEPQLIAAHVDGSLEDPVEATRIARLIETDQEASALAEGIRQSNATLRAAFDAPMHEPIPPAIAALFEGGEQDAPPAADDRRAGNVIAFAPRLRVMALPAALAASVLLGVGLGVLSGWEPASLAPGPSGRVTLGPGDGSRPVDRALDRLASGSTSPEGIRPLLSFDAGDGTACREFEVVGANAKPIEIGIACRHGGGWNVKIVVEAPSTEQPESGVIVPASGASFEALDVVLDALDAGPALAPDEEARRLAAGWRQAVETSE